MRHQNKFLLSSITLAVLTVMGQASAQQSSGATAADAAAPATAASAPAAPAAPAKDAVAAEVQQIVVTGLASGSKRKVDSAFSITTATEEQIKQASPTSTGDLLKIVPGVMAESTGGQSGANIDIRGFPSGSDSPFVTIQMNGSPIYPVSTLNFMEGTSLFRLDDTIERVEVLRGGPSPIFSDGQPGATMNFILKKGSDTPEGSLRATVGTGNLRRVDGFFGGKIADGWYGTIGGFHRTDSGVRNSQFPADEGGQLTATITHKLDQGEFTVYARAVNDKNAFYTSIPLMATGSGTDVKLSAYPGIDPLTYTPMGNELRSIRILTDTNNAFTKDLADGRGVNARTFGSTFDQKVNGWNVSNKMGYFSGNADTAASWPGSAPQTLQSYLDSAAAANGTTSAGATATYVSGGAVDPNQLVMAPTFWYVSKELQSFSDELRVSKEIFSGNTLTVGTYFANFSSKDRWYLGNAYLSTATSNAKPIVATLANGAQVTDAGGLAGGPFLQLASTNSGRNHALFLADEWQLTKELQVDAGFRHQSQTADINYSTATSKNLDGNPLTLYDNNVSVLTPATKAVHRDMQATSYTLGGGFKLAKDTSVFARINNGAAFPDVDTIRGTPDSPVQKIKQYEVGFKTVGEKYSAYLTAFHADFTGLSFLRITPTGNIITQFGSKGNGLEYELAVRPIKNLQIELVGDYQVSKYTDNPNIDGNTVTRQPKTQYRLTPSYRIPTNWGMVKLYGTYNYIGGRWNDQANTQYLPKYHTFDAGALVELGDNFEFRLSGTNITNELATTEGSNQVSTGFSTGPVFGRPLFGREIQASIMYRF
jgi:iron complex outermembrane recepter protein